MSQETSPKPNFYDLSRSSLTALDTAASPELQEFEIEALENQQVQKLYDLLQAKTDPTQSPGNREITVGGYRISTEAFTPTDRPDYDTKYDGEGAHYLQVQAMISSVPKQEPVLYVRVEEAGRVASSADLASGELEGDFNISRLIELVEQLEAIEAPPMKIANMSTFQDGSAALFGEPAKLAAEHLGVDTMPTKSGNVMVKVEKHEMPIIKAMLTEKGYGIANQDFAVLDPQSVKSSSLSQSQGER